MYPLTQLIPNTVNFFSLPVEDLAGVLLVYLNAWADAGSSAIAQHGRVSQSEFFNWLWKNSPYPRSSGTRFTRSF
jgi:hypothetical protein